MNPLKSFTPLHVAWLFALMCLPACEQSSIEMVELRKADTLTLYSIDGVTRELIPDLPLPDGEKFYNYPVLGRVEIPAGPIRDELLEEMEKCLSNRSELPSKCVFPRHALRGSKGQQNIDFVICFECNILYVFQSGQTGKTIYFNAPPSASKLFNKVLQDAGIELAPTCEEVLERKKSLREKSKVVE